MPELKMSLLGVPMGAVDLLSDFSVAWEPVANSLGGLWKDFLGHLPMLLTGLVVILITALLANVATRLTRRLVARERFNRSLRDFFRHLARISVWVTGLMIAAVVVFPGMTPAKVLATFGLGSIAIGFAFKDIVENFFAGMLILWRFPFDLGDHIECDDIMGEVVETTIRMTKIRQVDGQLVVLPNARLFKSPVKVLTNQPTRRQTILCGVAYEEDLHSAREIIRDAVAGCDSVESSQPIQVFVQELASSSVNLEIAWWTGSTPLQQRESRDEVIASIKQALDDASIEIPFPQRTLSINQTMRSQVDSLLNGANGSRSTKGD